MWRTTADDYLVKPFAIEELMARADALLRRSTRRDAPVLRVHVDVCVRLLRDKIDDEGRPDRPSFVQPARGMGYVLSDPGADQA